MATNTPNYNLKKPSPDDFYNVNDQNENMDKIDAALKGIDDELQSAGAEIQSQIATVNNKIDAHSADNVRHVTNEIAKFKRGTASFTDNDNSQTFTDAFCTVNSLVTVIITSETPPKGVWSVNSANGSFTITSTVAESADITFDYYIQKAVG